MSDKTKSVRHALAVAREVVISWLGREGVVQPVRAGENVSSYSAIITGSVSSVGSWLNFSTRLGRTSGRMTSRRLDVVLGEHRLLVVTL